MNVNFKVNLKYTKGEECDRTRPSGKKYLRGDGAIWPETEPRLAVTEEREQTERTQFEPK